MEARKLKLLYALHAARHELHGTQPARKQQVVANTASRFSPFCSLCLRNCGDLPRLSLRFYSSGRKSVGRQVRKCNDGHFASESIILRVKSPQKMITIVSAVLPRLHKIRSREPSGVAWTYTTRSAFCPLHQQDALLRRGRV